MSARCRLCGADLRTTFVDLGMSPPCESYLAAEDAGRARRSSTRCTSGSATSACSSSCRPTSRPRTSSATTPTSPPTPTPGCATASASSRSAIERLGLGSRLLRRRGGQQRRLPPAAHAWPAASARWASSRPPTSRWPPRTAACPPRCSSSARRPAARSPTIHGRADLVVANNVFAHVPDIVDFSRGLRELVADDGRVSIEIPHLLRLVEGNEFDTIYHEHYSYLSLLTTQRVLAAAGLTVVDVEELPTPRRLAAHLVGAHRDRARADARRWRGCWPTRRAAGLHTLEGHAGFASAVAEVRDDFVEFLIDCRRARAQRRGVRRPRQGQHPAQPLRCARRPAVLRRRPQPPQARQVPARHPHPGAARSRRSTRRGPTTS